MAENNTNSHTTNSGGGKAWLGVIGVVAMLCVLLAVGIIPRMKQNKKNDTRAHAAANEVPKVVVTKPKPSPGDALTLPGSTQAIQDAQVGARTTGYVTKRCVDIGAHVKAGQVLAEIESPDVDQQLYQAQAQEAQSKATVSQSEADVANKRATVAQYQSNVRQAQANVEQAKANLSNTKAKLAQLEAAEKTAEAQRNQTQETVGIKQAALRQANTQLNLAKLTYNRYLTLQKAGFVALQDVDQNRATFENAQAAVNSAQSDVNGAQANVAAAEANVKSAIANANAGVAEVRAAEKNVSAVAATVEAARSTVAAGVASVRGSQSSVAANEYAQVASKANSKRFSVLTGFEKVVAPFDGVITARNIEVGALVNSGSGAASGGSSGGSTSGTSAANLGSASTSSATPSTTSATGLFGLARTDTLRILVPVPQAFAPLVHQGQVTRIGFREYPGQTFDGTVAFISGALDTTSRTLLTEVHLPNRSGRFLPGMFAQVTFDVPKTTNALRVPATSVIFDAQGTRAAVIGAENKLHYVQVTVGRDFNTEIELIQGVRAGDTVVVTPSDDLVEGEKVNPVFPLPPPVAQPNGAPPGTAPNAPPKQPRGGNTTTIQ